MLTCLPTRCAESITTNAPQALGRRCAVLGGAFFGLLACTWRWGLSRLNFLSLASNWRFLWLCWLVSLAVFWGAATSASAQVWVGYAALPGFSENATQLRLGEAHRLAKVERTLVGQVRPQDEVWLLSTRNLCQRRSPEAGATLSAATVARWQDGVWMGESFEQLVLTINGDATRHNLLFIHGNRTDFHWASLRGMETYQSLIWHPEANGCAAEAPPVRWIIWAWNSDPIPGPRQDLASKKQRAIDQGSYLAELFHRLQCSQLGVITYSLGAQALASGLCDWQAMLDPQTVSAMTCPGPKMRVVMIAGALPTQWLDSATGKRCLTACLDHLTLLNNPADRVLDVYQKFTRQQPIGLRQTQLTCCVPSSTYLLNDCTLTNHFLSHYLELAGTRVLIRQSLLPVDPPLPQPVSPSTSTATPLPSSPPATEDRP